MQSDVARILLFAIAGLLCGSCMTVPPEPAQPEPQPEVPSIEPPIEPVRAEEQPAAPAPAAGNRWAEPAREVLLTHCGMCHDGARPASLERSRAVYDLNEEIWYARIAPQQYDRLLGRVRGNTAITEPERAVIENFVRCARDGECADPAIH